MNSRPLLQRLRSAPDRGRGLTFFELAGTAGLGLTVFCLQLCCTLFDKRHIGALCKAREIYVILYPHEYEYNTSSFHFL